MQCFVSYLSYQTPIMLGWLSCDLDIPSLVTPVPLAAMFFNCFLSISVSLAAVNAISIPTPTPVIARTADITGQGTSSITPSPSTNSNGYFISTELITVTGVTNDHVTVPGKTISIAIPTCVQTTTPDANGYVPPGTCNAFWDYYPSFVAAAVFACLFGSLMLVHACQAIRTNKVSGCRKPCGK